MLLLFLWDTVISASFAADRAREAYARRSYMSWVVTPRMIRLFASLERFVIAQPEENGLYNLQLPDALRWIKQEARCVLPAEKIGCLLSPMLRLTTSTRRGERLLSAYIGGDFLGTQPIGQYGAYYPHLPSELLNKSALMEICLQLDRAEPFEDDRRSLADRVKVF